MNNSIIEFLNLKEEEIASLTCQSTDVGLFVFFIFEGETSPLSDMRVYDIKNY